MKKVLFAILLFSAIVNADSLFVSDSTIRSCGYDPDICRFVKVGMMKYCGQQTVVKENGNIEVTLMIYHKTSRTHAVAYKAVYEKNGDNGFVWQGNDTVSVTDAYRSPILIDWYE